MWTGVRYSGATGSAFAQAQQHAAARRARRDRMGLAVSEVQG